jgi:hypothetical protein
MSAKTTNVAIEKEVHMQVKKHCDETGVKLKWFVRKSLLSALPKPKTK